MNAQRKVFKNAGAPERTPLAYLLNNLQKNIFLLPA